MVNVVYACNDAYVRQTIVSMVSVVTHNPEAKLYLVADLSLESRELIRDALRCFGQSIYFLELNNVLPEMELDEGDRHPKTVYAKLFLGRVIPERRILYLDSDVIVMQSLEPLFSRDMHGNAVGGVLMPYSSKLKKQLNCKEGMPYICDGIVLFNLDEWRAGNYEQACFDYIKKYHGNPPMLSEGTLNHICQDRMEVLDLKYNVMPSMLMYNIGQIRELFQADYYYHKANDLEEARKKPVIIHFMNELYNRPWLEPCDHPMKQEYRKLHEELFQDAAYPYENISFNTRLTRILKKVLPFFVFSGLYHLKHKDIM